MKEFTLGQILSVSTGKLMCPIGEVYEILDYLLDAKHFTHQLGRASADAKPWLLESLPWLSEITCDEVDGDNVWVRLLYYQEQYGRTHSLGPVPHCEELCRNPLDELSEMVDPSKIIPIQID